MQLSWYFPERNKRIKIERGDLSSHDSLYFSTFHVDKNFKFLICKTSKVENARVRWSVLYRYYLAFVDLIFFELTIKIACRRAK